MLLNTLDDQARALQKIFNDMGWDADPLVVSQRLQDLNKGLVQEDEFVFILNCMKNISMIHKLDQFQIPPQSKELFRVPDLIVVTNHNGNQSRYLIEVKTSKDPNLSWSERYYNGMKNYSDVVGIPLLVAWKWTKYDIWCLFGLEDFTQKEPGGNFKIDLNTANKRSLMSDLVGDYFIALPENLSLTIKHKKIRQKENESEETWETEIESVYLIGRDNQIVELGNVGLMTLFLCLHGEATISQDESYIYYKIFPSPNKCIYAQSIPVILTEMFAKKAVNWLEKIQEQSIPVNYDLLLADLTRAIDEGTVDHLFFTKPNYD